MRALDLFSGAGGAAMGLYRAGFTEIVGVDHRPQPRYPFEFIQTDVFEFLHGVNWVDFDLVWSSPPCQAHSVARPIQGREHPDLIPETRRRLEQLGIDYVIENVPGAPLLNPVMLCGLMFGLKVFRHRLFESSRLLLAPPHGSHRGREIGRDGFCCVAGHGDSGRGRVPSSHRTVGAWSRAIGIDWMTRDELAQAVPPCYAQFLGEQLIENAPRTRHSQDLRSLACADD
jgi:DNA (cytosine-5)-methyltransferase 1